MEAFFTTLHQALGQGDKLRLEFQRSGEHLQLLVIPMLEGDPDQVPEAARPIRAALAVPLSLRDMTPTELAAAFDQRFAGYAQARSEADAGYQELLAQLSDAKAAAKNAGSKASGDKKAGKKKEGTAPDKTQDAPAVESLPEPAPKKGGVLDF